MAKDSDNRLAAALKHAKQIKPKKHQGFTSRSASKARRKYLDEQNFLPTSTMRIQDDAISLAKAAWKNRSARVRECSEAIRLRARKKLNLPATSDELT